MPLCPCPSDRDTAAQQTYTLFATNLTACSIKSRKKPAPKRKGLKPPQHAQDTACKWCSRFLAKDVTCRACNKTGHFRNVFRSFAVKTSHPSIVNDITWDASNICIDVLKLAENLDAWYVVIASTVSTMLNLNYILDLTLLLYQRTCLNSLRHTASSTQTLV